MNRVFDNLPQFGALVLNASFSRLSTEGRLQSLASIDVQSLADIEFI